MSREVDRLVAELDNGHPIGSALAAVDDGGMTVKATPVHQGTKT